MTHSISKQRVVFKTGGTDRRVRAYHAALSCWRRINSAGFLSGDLGAFLAGFGQADGDGLLATFHPASLAAFSRTQRSPLFAMHGALHALACRFTVSGHFVFPLRTCQTGRQFRNNFVGPEEYIRRPGCRSVCVSYFSPDGKRL